jgi:alpha-L-fucosidase 2
MKLWYDHPAEQWEEALPIGNGRLGAMVFGTPVTEHLQLNEGTVWAGEPGNNIPGGFKEILPEVRRLIFEGKYKEAQNLVMTRIPRRAPDNLNYGMPYQPVGDLWIDFPGQGKITNYYRDLDIASSISSVSYEADGVIFKREYFATAVDQVIVLRLTANKKGKISFIMRADSPHTIKEVTVKGDTLVLTGTGESISNKKGRVNFNARFLPVIDGGRVEQKDSILKVENANSATIYVSIGTNFKNYKNISGDAQKMAGKYMRDAIAKPYNAIKQAHIHHYHKYFNRVQLDLGVTSSAKKPTDQRIACFKTGNDPQLAALYFQFGRYLLISCSQPGNQPANLQGIWNNQLLPSWDSKYTVNINIEMIYWPAEVTSLPEMAEPLFSIIKDLSETGRKAAKEMYGARGWMIHHNTDIWRFSGPIDGAYYEPWPMGGAWLSQHLWQHQKPGIKAPLIKEGVVLEKLNLMTTKLFDFETKKGGIYHFKAE